MVAEAPTNLRLTTGSPKVAVVLFHGMGGSSENLKVFMEPLFEAYDGELSLYAPLLPGHGTQPEDLCKVTAEDIVQTGLEAYDEATRGADKVIVVGYSMGTEAASVVAARMKRDKRLIGLIFMNGPRKVQDRRAFLVSVPILGWVIRQLVPENAILGAPGKGSFVYPWVPMWIVHQLNRLRKLGRRARRNINPDTHVLVIQGDADKTVNPAGANTILAETNASNKELQTIKGADHYFWGHESEVVTLILKFLEKLRQ